MIFLFHQYINMSQQQQVTQTPQKPVVCQTPQKPVVCQTPQKPQVCQTPQKPQVCQTPTKQKSCDDYSACVIKVESCPKVTKFFAAFKECYAMAQEIEVSSFF